MFKELVCILDHYSFKFLIHTAEQKCLSGIFIFVPNAFCKANSGYPCHRMWNCTLNVFTTGKIQSDRKKFIECIIGMWTCIATEIRSLSLLISDHKDDVVVLCVSDHQTCYCFVYKRRPKYDTTHCIFENTWRPEICVYSYFSKCVVSYFGLLPGHSSLWIHWPYNESTENV